MCACNEGCSAIQCKCSVWCSALHGGMLQVLSQCDSFSLLVLSVTGTVSQWTVSVPSTASRLDAAGSAGGDFSSQLDDHGPPAFRLQSCSAIGCLNQTPGLLCLSILVALQCIYGTNCSQFSFTTPKMYWLTCPGRYSMACSCQESSFQSLALRFNTSVVQAQVRLQA